MSASEKRQHKKPSLGYTVLTLVCLVAFIAVTYSVFQFPILISIFFSWLVVGGFALGLGYSLQEIEHAITELIKIGVGLFALLLAVGCLIAIMLSCGTVPTVIYWGPKLVTPKIFLPLAFTICSLIGMATGTSWGTTSTIGVAMMGVGLGLGIPAPMVAGAIISGCALGTDCSPVSDGPLLTSTICEIDVLKHCRHLVAVAVPAFVLSFIAYLIMGISTAGNTLDTAAIAGITDAIAANFKVGLIPFIPLVIVVALLVLRKPATTAIIIGSFVGIFVAVFYQGYQVSEVANFLASGFRISTGNTALDPILNRGGISSMLNLIATVVASLGLGGVLKECGTMDTLVESLRKAVKGRVGLTNASLLINIACNMMVATNYFASLISNTLLCPMYKQYGYAPENCSRINGFSAQMISDFVPWSLAGVFLATTLGVPTLQYIPFSLSHLFTIALCLIYGYTGFNMPKLLHTEPENAEA